MRGSTPLDVAAASVMDNNELALALREPDLEKVSSLPAAVQRAQLAHGCSSRLLNYSCHVITYVTVVIHKCVTHIVL